MRRTKLVDMEVLGLAPEEDATAVAALEAEMRRLNLAEHHQARRAGGEKRPGLFDLAREVKVVVTRK
jgi:hypothetical protein